jgi:hypothetical protein
MADIQNLTAQQLRRAADLQEKIEKLNGELQSILGGGNGVPSPARRGRPATAKLTFTKETIVKGEMPKRKMSAAGRAKIAAAAKARWAKVKAAGKNSL